jgi:hypothetical protein|nr:MAG TPA: hyaluronase tail fiber protein [Caudoviricetes sp.]
MADKRIGELPLIEDLDDESFFVAEQQGAAGHITGAQIKGFARKSVEDIANASQKSAEAAAKSASAAQESATQAEEAQEAAESAKSGAEVAQKAAETAQGAAADAQAGAESAKTAAEAAADVAAKDAAEGVREELSVYVEQTEANAQAAADSASEAAVSQEAAAQSAQGAAGSATAAAQDAVDAADARTAAEAAQGKAEAAQGAAEAAKSGAETAAGTATTKAEEASASAETAKQYSGKPPKPQNGTWWVWNAETQAYTDTGIKSVLSIVKSYPSVEAMEADKLNMHEGDLVIIASTVDDPDNSKLYVHDGVGWVYLSDLSGVEGVGIAGISQTDGNHAPGTTDTYTIELTNGSSYEFTVYNGADGDGSGDMQSSTYDPQGKAQDIFGYADNAAKGKQDKLKGTAGQVVGFDSEGNAIPQAAPSGLPDGGTVGQLLEKTEDGAEWADKPVMYVNITPPAGDSPFGTADHTIAEITQAVLNGVTVLSKISAGTDTKVIPLSSVTDSVASFSSTSVDYGGSVIANIVPQEQSEVVIIAEDQFRASQILYDKGTSGLDSDDVQGAIKELAKNKQDSADAVTVPGGGTMQMGESLGNGPYTIEVTEDGEGGDLSAEYVGYSNTGSGLEATNVQEAIDELAQKGGGEYLPLTGGTMQGDITIPADKAIKHGGSAAQIKMMPNGNIRIEAPLAEGAAAITVGTSGINLVNNTTQVLQTSESGVALKANTDMTGHKIANLAAPSDSADAANKQYVDTSVEQALGSIGYSLIKEYTSPGSYTHTFDRKYTDVFVVVVGAGGGGGSSGERGGGGGGGGAVACFHVLDSSTIQNNNIVVGTGGAGAVSSLGPSVTNNGSAGGSSSAFGITVPGGSGGIANLGGMGGGYAPNEIVPGWLMIGGSGGSHNNNGDGDGNAGPIISIVGFKPFGGGGGGGGNPSLNDPPTPGGNGGDGGAGNGGAGATGQSNAIMGKNGTRGGGGGGGGAGWTFRSSEYKPSGIGGKGGDGYVAIYGRE